MNDNILAQDKFRNSPDVSFSKYVGDIMLRVQRPKQGAMYGVYIGEPKEEVAIIGGSTSEAEKVFNRAKEILASNLDLEQKKQKIREYIAEIHGGLQQ